jgi:hypothetical protein
VTVEASRAQQTSSATSPSPSVRSWSWPLLWLAVAAATALLVRLPGPATLDPDEHAAALYFDRLVHGQRLEEPLLSAPKPLLTGVHGLAWALLHDWRVLEALAVAAFALAVVCLARAARRLAGAPAAVATVVAVVGSGPLVLQAARGNSLVFAMAGWAVALDALTRCPPQPGPAASRLGPGPAVATAVAAPRGRGPAVATAVAAPRGRGPAVATAVAAPRGRGQAAAPAEDRFGPDPAGAAATGCRPAWGVAAAALALAALARAETWPLLPLAAAWGVVAWRRGERRAALLLLPLAAPLLWFAHDWLLTGDPLYTLRIPDRYTDLVAGRQVVAPASWLALVGRRYAASPLLLGLAAVGVVWLARRRAWVWLAGLGVATVGLLSLLGLEAWRGTYVSWRYFDPADLAVRLAAAIAAGRMATALVGRLAATRVGAVTGGRLPVGGPGNRLDGGVAAVLGVLLVGVACWPLAPADPLVGSTLDRDTGLSRNAATAVGTLRPVAAEPGAVLTLSGPQRVRVALELGLPLGRARDLFLATRAEPLDRALAGSAAVFHDADGDRPPERFAPLSVTSPTTVGSVEVEPLRTDPGRGLYVLRVR